MGISKLTLAIGAIFVAVAAGGGVYYFKRRVQPAPQVNFETAMRALKAQGNSPQKDLFVSKNLVELKNIIDQKADWAHKAATLQAGIVYFDSNPNANWTPTDFAGLADVLMSNMDSKGHEPDEKKTQVLGFHLLKRILPHVEDKQIHTRIDKTVAGLDCKKDNYTCVNYLDLASVMSPVSDKTIKKIEQCLVGTDLGLAQSCLSITEQVHETAKLKSLVQYIAEHYPQMKEPLRPYAARVLFAQHDSAPARAKEVLGMAAHSDLQPWQDVFIFGVAEMKVQDIYRARLVELSQRAESPTVRQRAKSLVR